MTDAPLSDEQIAELERWLAESMRGVFVKEADARLVMAIHTAFPALLSEIKRGRAGEAHLRRPEGLCRALAIHRGEG